MVDLGESGWKSGEIAGRVNEADHLSLVLPVCRVLPWRQDNDKILIGFQPGDGQVGPPGSQSSYLCTGCRVNHQLVDVEDPTQILAATNGLCCTQGSAVS